jgi:uncharacterized protein YlaI
MVDRSDLVEALRRHASALLPIPRLRTQIAPDQPAAENCGCDPDGDNDRCSSPADRPVVGCRSQFAVLRHDICRDQANDEPNPGRYQDHIIQIAEHRHEIGDQIDRGKRIGRNKYRQRLCVPWDSRIATTEIDRVNVPLNETSPILHSARPCRASAGGAERTARQASPHYPDHSGRICGLLPAMAKILLNDPGVKMQDERSPHVRAIPPAANGRCRRLRVNCDQAAFCRDCATWVAITSISAGDRQS